MTLLELMVVAGVLSVLLGLGVGFLRRSDGMPEARSALSGQLRLAALDARSRGLPTEVVLARGDDGAPATVVARGLDPVLLVTFDPGQTFSTAATKPMFGGEEVPAGRCGRGRTTRDGDASPAVRIPMGPALIDLRDGFAIRCDVRLSRRDAGRLLRLGRGIDVGLDELARPYARLLGGSTDGRTSTAVNLKATAGLPIDRWCTFELGADGSRAWCSVDGRLLAQEDLHERLLQQKDDVFELLPGDQPVPGAVDELQVFAYAWAPAMRLPDTVLLDKPVRVVFDASGEPIAPPEIRFEVGADKRIEVLHVGPGGVLQ